MKEIANNGTDPAIQMLIEGPQAAPPHHASLQTAFDLSYEPLPEA